MFVEVPIYVLVIAFAIIVTQAIRIEKLKRVGEGV